jgi:hypothetical protein
MEEVVLSQFPCWKHLEPEAYRSRRSELVREIEAAAAADSRETGKEPPGGGGASGVRLPESRPRKIKEVASSVRPRSDKGGAQGDVGGLRLARGGVPQCGERRCRRDRSAAFERGHAKRWETGRFYSRSAREGLRSVDPSITLTPSLKAINFP